MAMVPEYEHLRTRHADVEKSVRDLGEQLDDIAYLESSLHNDLRQIERAGGAGDKGPIGARQILQALVGTIVCFGGLFFWVLMLEFCFGKVRGGIKKLRFRGAVRSLAIELERDDWVFAGCFDSRIHTEEDADC